MNLIRKSYGLLLFFLQALVLQAQSSHWEVNIYDYQYDMSVYASLLNDDAVVTDFSNYEVAAFVGDECRGIAEVQSTEKDGQTYLWLNLRVRSHVASGETVTFRVFDKEKNRVLRTNETLEFVHQSIAGMPSSPFEISIQKYVVGDVNDDTEINIADVTALVKYISGTLPPFFIEAAADVNQDNEVDISDVVSLVKTISNN